MGVSIHAFRGEGDDGRLLYRGVLMVSIHAFRGEGDLISWINSLIDIWFQSTPSGGKATAAFTFLRRIAPVSIHAFRGEGDIYTACCDSAEQTVSIHAFRGEGDNAAVETLQITMFQSTPSGGKATASSCNCRRRE